VSNVVIIRQRRWRYANWSPPRPRYETGVMAKYAALVSSAAEGAVTRPVM
jgi:dihydroxy-acid dehydratase